MNQPEVTAGDTNEDLAPSALDTAVATPAADPSTPVAENEPAATQEPQEPTAA